MSERNRYYDLPLEYRSRVDDLWDDWVNKRFNHFERPAEELNRRFRELRALLRQGYFDRQTYDHKSATNERASEVQQKH